MKHYMNKDGSISSYPYNCENFAPEHPVHEARELTEEEFEKEMDKRKPPERKLGYKEKRRAEYPQLEELAEAISDRELGNPQTMLEYMAKVVAVKAKYPKED